MKTINLTVFIVVALQAAWNVISVSAAKVCSDPKNFNANLDGLLVGVQQAVGDIAIINDGGDSYEWSSLSLRLSSISKAIESFKSVSANVQQNWINGFENEAEKQIDTWYDWVDTQTNSLGSYVDSDKKIANALDDFINFNKGSLYECIDQTRAQQFNCFGNDVINAAKSYSKSIGSVNVQIQNCLRSPSVQCQRAVSDKTNLLRKIPQELNALTAKGNALTVTFENIDCVKDVLQDAQNEQQSLASQIQAIVKKTNG